MNSSVVVGPSIFYPSCHYEYSSFIHMRMVEASTYKLVQEAVEVEVEVEVEDNQVEAVDIFSCNA